MMRHRVVTRAPLALFLAVPATLLAASPSAAQGGVDPTTELPKLQALAAAIPGSKIAFTGYVSQKVYVMEVGVPDTVAADGRWKVTELCDGYYARFSEDGARLAVAHGGSLYVADATTGVRTLVLSSAYSVSGTIPPLDFRSDPAGPAGDEIVFTQEGILAVKVASPHDVRLVADAHAYDGEPGIAASGKRIAARDAHELFAIVAEADDPADVGDRLYCADGCSAGLSPDGARLMYNTFEDAALGVGFHSHLVIRDWDGSSTDIISANICQPEAIWDNHHWSNHPSYIAVQGEDAEGLPGELYIVDVSDLQSPVGTRVTWGGDVLCPDLWVADMVKVTGKITSGGAGISGAVVTLTDGSSVSVTTHTDDDGEFTILATAAEIPDAAYDIEVLGLTNPVAQVTVAGGAADAGTVAATQLDADAAAPDGLPDWWELRYFADLTVTDGTGDADSDGKTDLQEYQAGTSPVAGQLTSIGGGGGGCTSGATPWTALGFLCTILLSGLALRHRSRRAGT